MLLHRTEEQVVNTDLCVCMCAVCSAPGGIQCPGNGMCVGNDSLCDGQMDCQSSSLDESPIFCGELCTKKHTGLLTPYHSHTI
jgi:hypothetical protein